MTFFPVDSVLGQLLRWPLGFIPKSATVPVISGHLRGMKWIVGSATHGCWLGTYESSKQDLMARHIRPDSCVYDVGAHVGFYTLLAARLAPRGRVASFEPLPRNAAFLRRHIALNRLANVQVFEEAVSDSVGTATFLVANDNHEGALDGAGNMSVQTITIDSLVAGGRLPPPDVLKMDIEGGELLALKGAQRTLRDHAPAVFLATHGLELARSCRSLLGVAGYGIVALDSNDPDSASEFFASKDSRP